MLNNLLEEVGKLGMGKLPTGLFTFLLGVVVTFLGMTLLVLCVAGVGKILSVKDEKKAKTPVTIPLVDDERPVVTAGDDDIPEDVKVAIIAAISAYYDAKPASANEFVVKKIKRIK